jgi:hypothetical protein
MHPPEGDPGLGSTFYCNVTRESCLQHGLLIDPQTDQWWASQSEAAQAAFTKPDPIDLLLAMHFFVEWLRTQELAAGAVRLMVWAHGSGFDLPMLRVILHKLGWEKMPWHYQAERDTRTLFMMGHLAAPDLFNQRIGSFNTGTQHNALDDAITQAKQVQFAYGLVV